MSDDNSPQRYIAYRSESARATIRFVGGPLDGDTIETDIIPGSDTFIHRVRDREYRYRYHQESSLLFVARFAGYKFIT